MTDAELVSDIDVALVVQGARLLDLLHRIFIPLPNTPAEWTGYLAVPSSVLTLCGSPHREALLVDILAAGCSTPHNGLLGGVELVETYGTVALDGFSILVAGRGRI